jgi:hypothetical protein
MQRMFEWTLLFISNIYLEKVMKQEISSSKLWLLDERKSIDCSFRSNHFLLLMIFGLNLTKNS